MSSIPVLFRCPSLVALGPALLWLACGTSAAQVPDPDLQSVLSRARERGRVVVCVPRESVGLAHRNPRNGVWSGADVDLASQLASRLRLDVHWLQTSGSELPGAMAAGRCDLAAGGWTASLAHSAGLPASRPLMQVDVAAVIARRAGVRPSWDQVIAAPSRVAVLESSGSGAALRALLGQGRVRESDDLTSLLQQLQSGRVDALMVDRARGLRIVRDDPSLALVAPAGAFHVQDIVYVLPAGDNRWRHVVDEFVAQALGAGTVDRLAERHGLQRPEGRP